MKIFMWISIAQAVIYTSILTCTEFIKYYDSSTFKYGTVSVVLVCTVKSLKLVNDTIVHYLFLRFLIFFLNFRKEQSILLTRFNKVILTIVIILFLASYCQSLILFLNIFSYIYQTAQVNSSVDLIELIIINIFSIKDFMIAILLSYLYYFKGKQALQSDKQRIVISMRSSLNIDNNIALKSNSYNLAYKSTSSLKVYYSSAGNYELEDKRETLISKR